MSNDAFKSIYNKPTTNDYGVLGTPVGKSHHFTLSVMAGGYGNNTEFIDPRYDKEHCTIEGILDELPQVSVSTEWDVAGVSKIDDMVKKISDNSMVKAFSQLSTNYMTPVSTDGWTQQFPKKSCLISFDLKFRAYYEAIYNTTPYNDIIRLLTYSVTPKKYNITDSMDAIADGLDVAISGGNELVKVIDTMPSRDDFPQNGFSGEDDPRLKEINDKLDNATKTFDKIYKETIGKFVDQSSTGGCSRFIFAIPNYIKQPKSAFYYVSSWSFTPSPETIFTNDRHYPAYIDFNISIESDRYVDNTIMNEIFVR